MLGPNKSVSQLQSYKLSETSRLLNVSYVATVVNLWRNLMFIIECVRLRVFGHCWAGITSGQNSQEKCGLEPLNTVSTLRDKKHFHAIQKSGFTIGAEEAHGFGVDWRHIPSRLIVVFRLFVFATLRDTCARLQHLCSELHPIS
jgi:hypothetical protein